MPVAVPSSRPWNSCAISASETENITAPPTPWNARAMFSAVAVGARAQASEDSVKITRPQTNTRRRPRRSASDPALSVKAASVSV